MTTFEKPPRYKTFLLTMWEERSLEQPQSSVWRFGLEDPQTGRRRAFASVPALSETLQQMINLAEATDEAWPALILPAARPSELDDQNLLSSKGKEI